MHTTARSESDRAVRTDLLRWCCDPMSLPFETTEELERGDIFLGQPRAQKAIQFGLELQGQGYHILVCGTPGTGRKTLIQGLIQKTPSREPRARDLVYVHNFREPGRPLGIILKQGEGYAFRDEMNRLIGYLQEKIPDLLNEAYMRTSTESLLRRYEQETALIRESFEQEARKRSFCTTAEEAGERRGLPQCVPCPDQGPVPLETLADKARRGEITDKEYGEWQKRHRELSRVRRRLMIQLLNAERSFKEEVHQQERDAVKELVHLKVGELRRRFKETRVRDFLDEVERALFDDLSRVKAELCPGYTDGPGGARMADPFGEFRVNLLLDTRSCHAAPVVFEPFPSLENVFGSMGVFVPGDDHQDPEFLTIRPGSLHRAFGGYLVLDLKDLLHDHGVWTQLKQCLKRDIIDIPHPAPPSPAHTCVRPEPFPLDVKVIALADEDLYRRLYNDDPDIDELFKIRADFDQVLDRTEENILGYCAVVSRLCRQESLPQFHRTGAAVLVETAVERAGKKGKLSARIAEIADIAREAAYWARKEGSPLVHGQHVDKALSERRYRNDLVDEQLRELIQEGTICIETTGSSIGQVNGIALYDVGEYLFGKPCRITAQTSMGRAGVINIEREANLSGKFHDKGILILCGYLRDRYAHDKPLNLSASICIEQFYADIEGDSASLAEVCALFSSLAGVPVKQGIAVTGSISQKGEVQAVGSVNEKVTGFFDVCRSRGLTGEQGVIVPSGNVQELMLPKEIVQAVEGGRFHLFQVATVDDAMEILTGRSAGQRNVAGVYPSGSINEMVDTRLRELAERLRDFYNEVAEEEERWEQE